MTPPKEKKIKCLSSTKTPGGSEAGGGVVYFKRSCQKEHVFVLINLQKKSNPKIIILSIHFQLLSHTDWPPTHPAGRGRNNNSWRSSSVSPVLLLQVQSGYSTNLTEVVGEMDTWSDRLSVWILSLFVLFLSWFFFFYLFYLWAQTPASDKNIITFS